MLRFVEQLLPGFFLDRLERRLLRIFQSFSFHHPFEIRCTGKTEQTILNDEDADDDDGGGSDAVDGLHAAAAAMMCQVCALLFEEDSKKGTPLTCGFRPSLVCSRCERGPFLCCCLLCVLVLLSLRIFSPPFPLPILPGYERCNDVVL